jgi:hypothetical protein
MTTKRFTVVAILVAACGGSPPSHEPGVASADLRAGAAGDVAAPVRPFSGACTTTGVVAGQVLVDGVPGLLLTFEATCRLTHLGLTHATATQQVLFTGPSEVTISNTTTYVAANGDTLNATFTGAGTQVGLAATFSGTQRFTGGTGRFADATGEAKLEGTAAFDPLSIPPGGDLPTRFTGEYELRGTIAY